MARLLISSLFALVLVLPVLTLPAERIPQDDIEKEMGILDDIEKEMGVASTFIHGGTPTTAKNFPWQVYVHRTLLSSSTSYCGGSIISLSWILSAAHCFRADPPNQAEVIVKRIEFYAGLTNTNNRDSSDVQKRTLEENEFTKHMFIHSQYGIGTNLNNDIAIFKLKVPFTLTVTVKPIALATPGDFKPGKELIATGWGLTCSMCPSSNILQTVGGLNLVTRSECRAFWGQHFTDKMICHNTKDKDVCYGDSGGPVITGKGNSNKPPYVQIGIASFVTRGICLGNYSGFTDVAQFRPWIKKTTNDNCLNLESDSQCQMWADDGYCTTAPYTDYMVINCEKTCNKCDICLNLESDNQCQMWANNGYCTTAPYTDYMVINCEKTCNKCGEIGG